MEAASDVAEVIGNDPECYGRRGAGTDFESDAFDRARPPLRTVCAARATPHPAGESSRSQARQGEARQMGWGVAHPLFDPFVLGPAGLVVGVFRYHRESRLALVFG